MSVLGDSTLIYLASGHHNKSGNSVMKHSYCCVLDSIPYLVHDPVAYFITGSFTLKPLSLFGPCAIPSFLFSFLSCEHQKSLSF